MRINLGRSETGPALIRFRIIGTIGRLIQPIFLNPAGFAARRGQRRNRRHFVVFDRGVAVSYMSFENKHLRLIH